MKTLEEILIKERQNRKEEGPFGIKACKESIKAYHDFFKESYYFLLEDYVDRTNKDPFFNSAMVLACWELINEKKGE